MLAVLAVALVAMLAVAFVSATTPSSSNLVSIENIADSEAVLREQRLFDGKLPAVDGAVNDFVATVFLNDDAFILFDLTTVRTLRYVQLDSFRGALGVQVSEDGREFHPLALETATLAGRAVSRFSSEEGTRARYLKLARVRATGAQGAAFELVVLSRPPRQAPVVHALQHPPTYQQTLAKEFRRLEASRFVKVGMLAAFGTLWLFVRRRGTAFRLLLSGVFFFVAFVAWFGFQNPLKSLHPWETTHYYLGPKYFEELRYDGLYDEIARHEVAKGRGKLVAANVIRDLSTYELDSGTVALDPGLAAKTRLGPARSREFSSDADRIRRLFKYRHFQKVTEDHGYNATPLFTVVFGGLFQTLEPSRVVLVALALADILLVLGGLSALWLAFGPSPACLAALVVGLGEPWAFLWTGGSIGRYLWFFLFCSGLALLKSDRRFLAGFALCMAGLLRAFPLVFLAGLAVVTIYRMSRGEERREGTLLLLGISCALVIGLVLPSVVYSAGIYGEFFANLRLHSQNLSQNRIGLGAMLDVWDSQRSPVFDWCGYAIGAVGFGVLCACIAKRRLALWHTFVASGLLLWFVSPLSSYDYVWLACLAPVCIPSSFRTLLLLLTLAVLTLVAEHSFGLVPEILTGFVGSAGFLLLVGSYAVELARTRNARISCATVKDS
jgi:hypothetical protein